MCMTVTMAWCVQEGLDDAIKRIEQEQTSTCEEKTNAALALAVVARVSDQHFGEFVDQSMRALHAAALAFQPDIRRAALTALAPCIASSVTAFSKPMRSWSQSTVLHATTETHADAAIVTCLLALQDDDDAKTVARACDCVGAIAQHVGWPFVRLYLKRLTKRIIKIMTERALCNRRPDKMSWQTAQDLYGAVAHMFCALSRAWATDVELQTLSKATDIQHTLVAASDSNRQQIHLTDETLKLADAQNDKDQRASKATWAILQPALAEWQNILDEVFPTVLDWAGPHQPHWLRRLAFGLVGSLVRDLPCYLHPKAMGAFDRYSMPLFPLLNFSLSQTAYPENDGTDADNLEDVQTALERRLQRSANHQMLQNAAYCVGVLATQGLYPHTL
jgi:hypothetical protein